MRVTSRLFVSALVRRAAGEGAYATVVSQGAAEAGAVFLILNDMAGKFSLLVPAPQVSYGEESVEDRLFERVLEGVAESDIGQRLERERQFDPDIWVVEIEDRAGRSFSEEV